MERFSGMVHNFQLAYRLALNSQASDKAVLSTYE